jgi:hypothetical protein
MDRRYSFSDISQFYGLLIAFDQTKKCVTRYNEYLGDNLKKEASRTQYAALPAIQQFASKSTVPESKAILVSLGVTRGISHLNKPAHRAIPANTCM